MRILTLSLLITGLLTLSAQTASAAPRDARVAKGFCTVHQDGTTGVRFDGASYSAWLAVNALNDEPAALRDLVRKFRGNELAAATELALLRKAAAAFQRSHLDVGQKNLCAR